MNKEQIIQRAKEFCVENSIKTFPVNIVELCSRYGFKVFEEYLPVGVSGFVVVQEENFGSYDTNQLIVVNLLDSARRRRFTIAHELAHFILHRENGEVYAHRDAGQNGGVENEANIFASSILMPKELVESALSHLEDEMWGEIPLSVKASYIANNFAVSLPAARVRLEQLGLLR